MNVLLGKRGAFSLIELLAVVVVVGVLATLLIPWISQSSDVAKEKSCFHNRSEINFAIEKFGVDTGSYPTDISDLNTDDYFPGGIPTCPLTGSAYTMNGTTFRVDGHTTTGSNPGDH